MSNAMRFGEQRPDWPEYLAGRANQTRNRKLADYFSTGSLSADMAIGEAPLVALDLETTGLDATRHDIVSIGVMPFTLERIRVSDGRYWVLSPRRALSDESVAFHHITHTEVAQAPDFATIIDELLACLKGRLVVVHYRQLERSFIDAAVRERLGEGLLFPVIDTMSLEARIHRQSWWARLRRWAGRPVASIRLHESRLRYNLPAYTGHHALVDALATAELLQAQIARHYRWETPVGELWR
ncbi:MULTISPECIES: 3'-5' exonuclease [unclassified Modicisalibacter]|uniref:3'-5' exonuclease n=1 Tax=unclassified Modicisalibacter TaxID=2679913 RepID=UPI001CCF6D0C|nr:MULTISPECIES: 3'-5' exonuclease [unclassified Modicisalibacter]MBZ9557134.1 3'-5' exonuclease [Modicisalibacter sp. R2A 31.J]MBZ9574152.1 3'-5' exonuclease [Modicisalibacter sp. MOD 31.J]